MMASHVIKSISMGTGTAAVASSSNRRFAQHPAPEDVPMPEYVRDYYANSQTVTEFFPALEQRLEAMNTHRSLIHEASAEGASAALIAHAFLLAEESSEMARFRADQSRRQAALQSVRNGFAAKLDCVSAWKMVSAVLFTITAAVSAAGAAVNATADSKRPVAAAAAAAASILLVAMGKWIDSLLKKSESGVKKHMEVIRAMIMAGKVTIKDLGDIYVLARDMKTEAESIAKMVDDGAMEMEVDLKNKVAALNNSFEKVLRRANDGSLNASSAREIVLETILKNTG